jgi:hypothetical protein
MKSSAQKLALPAPTNQIVINEIRTKVGKMSKG